MKKAIPEMILILALTGMLMLAFVFQQAKSSEPPATEWSKTYGGTKHERVDSVVQTSDGGYAMAGYTLSLGAGASDFWLVKTNSTGHMQWNQTYGGTNEEPYACSVVETSDGGYAIAGETNSFGAGDVDFWLVKTNSTGHMQWNQTYGGTNLDRAHSMVQTGDGGYAIAGETFSFGAGLRDSWLVKTNSTGHMQWNQTYGGTKHDAAQSVVQTSDGGYTMAGHTWLGADADLWLVKVNSTGYEQWNKTYGGAGWDFAECLVETSDGEYAIAGGIGSFGAGASDFWLVKTDAGGNMQWDKTYGGTNDEYATCLVETGDGGYAMAGLTRSFGAGDWDFWLVKTDSTGNMEWNQTYGGTNGDAAQSVVQTGDGGYAIAGETGSFGAGGFDFWLIKLAPEEIPATIDIDPDTLNLKSNGQWITAYITLPEGYSVGNIDVASVELVHNDFVLAADWGEVQDGVLMVKFDRASLRDYLGEVDVDDGDKFYDVTLTVKGEVAGTPFEGSDTITVKRK